MPSSTPRRAPRTTLLPTTITERASGRWMGLCPSARRRIGDVSDAHQMPQLAGDGRTLVEVIHVGFLLHHVTAVIYPFIPVIWMPLTKYSWAKKKIRMQGNTAAMEAISAGAKQWSRTPPEPRQCHADGQPMSLCDQGQEVVPMTHEGEDGDRSQRRLRQGQHDAPQDAGLSAPVYPGSVVELQRNGGEELAQEKDAEGAATEEGRHDQGVVGVDPVELPVEDEQGSWSPGPRNIGLRISMNMNTFPGARSRAKA